MVEGGVRLLPQRVIHGPGVRLLNAIKQISSRAGSEVSLRDIATATVGALQHRIVVPGATNSQLSHPEAIGGPCCVQAFGGPLGQLGQVRHVRTAIREFRPNPVHTNPLDADRAGRIATAPRGCGHLEHRQHTARSGGGRRGSGECEGDTVRRCGLRTDVADLMRGADVLALPSCHEGWGGAVPKVRGLGRPTVASDIGALGELVGRPQGWHVSAGDVAGFGTTRDEARAGGGHVQRRECAGRAMVDRSCGFEPCIRGMPRPDRDIVNQLPAPTARRSRHWLRSELGTPGGSGS
jgi:glycosyltransferase involved in cell wall biosynthesis